MTKLCLQFSDVLLHLFSLNFAHFDFLSSFAFPLVVFHPSSSSSCYCPRLFMIVLEFYGISMSFISARLLECKTSFFCLVCLADELSHQFPCFSYLPLSVLAPFPSCWRCLGCIHHISSFSSLSLPVLLKKREPIMLPS